MEIQQFLADIWPLAPTYAHLLLSAIFPIYVGAHASLSRPASAEKPDKRSDGDKSWEDDEEEDQMQRMEGLSPSDAIIFPIMAGCTLAGLYFLIKWLQDPALLNKILNAYFAIFGALSVAKLLADALGLLENLVFPGVWVKSGIVWKVNSAERKVIAANASAAAKPIEARTSPLPGLFSGLTLPGTVEQALWRIRELPHHKWTIQLYIQHIAAGKTHIGINGFISIVLSLLAAMYYNLVDKPWFLTNLMGFGFSYSALQLLSPTTFTTGTLILSALFFYDIYFVFYTPMMVTVAKSLDVPIKLMFPRPAAPGESPEAAARSHAMLGLGDVVLPGIMIGLALRYDLFMHYVRKQKRTKPGAVHPPVTSESQKAASEDSTSVEITKAPYASLAGKYGNAFWTHSWFGRPLLPTSVETASGQPDSGSPQYIETSFPKPFFYASVTGYLLGLLVTLGVMHIWNHAQPALLYLVPGVLLSLFATGAIRGELASMWDYTEEELEEPSTPTNGDAKASHQNGDAGSQPSDKKAGSADDEGSNKPGTARETVRIGQHDEEAVFKLSVSRKPFPTTTKSLSGASDDKSNKLD